MQRLACRERSGVLRRLAESAVRLCRRRDPHRLPKCRRRRSPKGRVQVPMLTCMQHLAARVQVPMPRNNVPAVPMDQPCSAHRNELAVSIETGTLPTVQAPQVHLQHAVESNSCPLS